MLVRDVDASSRVELSEYAKTMNTGIDGFSVVFDKANPHGVERLTREELDTLNASCRRPTKTSKWLYPDHVVVSIQS